MSGLAFIDTETTGLDPDIHAVWEIAVILPDGPHEGEHCWQVYLGETQIDAADPVALEINGFHARYRLGAAVSPRASASRFAELVEGRHLVGAVPSFDEERLRRMHDLHLGKPKRYPWHYHLIDVEAMAAGALATAARMGFRSWGEIELPWRSYDLSRALGVEPPPPEERHSALADARWARAMYTRVVSW